MKLLAFETSTEACSVAVWVDGQVHERFEIAPRRHTELALPWAEALLAEAGIKRAQLDAIAVGRGPGAFTGVRLAIGIAQGIALALDRPVIAVSTLAALALRAPSFSFSALRGEKVSQADEGRFLAAIDARMGEVYLGAFACDDGGLIALSSETVIKPELAQIPEGDSWHAVGTGFAASEGALQTRLAGRLATVDAQALPHAADVAHLAALAYARGEGQAPERIEPAYLRNDVALTLAQQQALRKPSSPTG